MSNVQAASIQKGSCWQLKNCPSHCKFITYTMELHLWHVTCITALPRISIFSSATT